MKLPLAVRAPRAVRGIVVQDRPISESDAPRIVGADESVQGQSNPAENSVRAARLPLFALCMWAALAFLVPSFVQALNLVDVLAFPLGYFMAAQGILLGLLLVAWGSARWQNRRATRP
ncbi:hypothetical protein APY04_2092 [Hyphomicrobium sulfonivorans]|uniref:Sodium symporter small subunit domain-containing protein n=1 Tax=Hyphomicrobium sulfonivorans TaxID=121290 RepID=A0A125NUM1_HYPSL|nr:hypothetical protein APY04_2092 [Hyphomicrobium sulfonivorans]